MQRRVNERRDAEALAASPSYQLALARQRLEAATQKLQSIKSACDRREGCNGWGELRELLAQPLATRGVLPPGTRGRLEFLERVTAVDAFAYAQQQRNWREKYPQGWDQFLARNDDIDISEPSASRVAAKAALDALLAEVGEIR